MHVFITRAQTPDSEFSRLLRAKGWEVYGQSLVTLEPLPFEAVPDCDWIFFAGKNAVHFFFEQVRKQDIPLPAVQWAALGAATAEALSSYVETVDFMGNGDPESSAKVFQTRPITTPSVRVLFPAARHSMKSIASYLDDHFQAIHLEVYNNQPIACPPQRNDQVLVFTSPMNARTYFSRYPLLPFQKVVAIGATTAKALHRLGISDVMTAAAPNERSLAERVMNDEL